MRWALVSPLNPENRKSMAKYSTRKYKETLFPALQAEAAERRVKNTDIYRNAELKELLAALDADDKAEASAITQRVTKRHAGKTKPAAEAMKKAKAVEKAGPQETPKEIRDRDLAEESLKAKAALEQAQAEQKKAREANVAAPAVDIEGEKGAEMVAAFMDRLKARQALEAAKKSKKRTSPLAELAKRFGMEVGKNDPAARPVQYRVLKSSRFYTAGGVQMIREGSIVSDQTHNMDSLYSAGIDLEEIDGQVELVRDAMGTIIGDKVVSP